MSSNVERIEKSDNAVRISLGLPENTVRTAYWFASTYLESDVAEEALQVFIRTALLWHEQNPKKKFDLRVPSEIRTSDISDEQQSVKSTRNTRVLQEVIVQLSPQQYSTAETYARKMNLDVWNTTKNFILEGMYIWIEAQNLKLESTVLKQIRE